MQGAPGCKRLSVHTSALRHSCRTYSLLKGILYNPPQAKTGLRKRFFQRGNRGLATCNPTPDATVPDPGTTPEPLVKRYTSKKQRRFSLHKSMDYCVNNQIFYFNLFNPPKQFKQQTLINQTFNPQASNTYAQTDDKTFVLPYLPVEMQQNSAEKYAPKAALNLFQNCREHRFNCKTSDRPPQRSPRHPSSFPMTKQPL